MMTLQDDMRRYLSDYQPDTKNGVPHCIGDWINTNIRHSITSETVDVIEFPRRNWRGKLIIDRENRVTFTILREKRLKQIMKTVKKQDRHRPHYIETLLRTINAMLEPRHKQLSLESSPPYEFAFSNSKYETDLISIFSGCLDNSEGYIHCLILYEAKSGELTGIRLMLLDRMFEIVESKNLRNLIIPDFSTLSQPDKNPRKSRFTVHGKLSVTYPLCRSSQENKSHT